MKAKKLLTMLIAAAGLAVAQPDTKNKIAGQISELIETQDAAVKKFMDEVRALPREKQREAYQKGYPQFDDTIEALYTIVEENPAEVASLKAISWISSHSRGKELKPEIFAALEKHHLDHSELSEVILSFYTAKGEDTQAFLATVIEKSKAQDARGSALYIQATQIERDTAKTAQYKALVKKLNAEHANLEVRGRRVAAMMKATLEAKEKLAIGKSAPEIIGKDVDGKEMKLSDYNGKIVVLDFWGDW
jgi:hypothetical protein